MTFFSISVELVPVDVPLAYDIYINSSVLENKDHFVKLYPKKFILTSDLIKEAKNKYFQFYLREEDRQLFLTGISKNVNSTDLQKTEFIKNSAIIYLEKIFQQSNDERPELSRELVSGCIDSVIAMVEILKNHELDDMQMLIGNLSVHDFYTFDHSVNVSMYCISIYSMIRPSAPIEELILVGLGGLFHDIGKLKLRTDIINKPAPLNNEEKNEISDHPKVGCELLKGHVCESFNLNFEIIRRVVLEHHENFDGSGYPQKLSGAQIHFMSRLTSLADVFDALTTKRPYQETLSYEEALKIMFRSKDKKFDPYLFAAFARKIDMTLFKLDCAKELPHDFDPCQPQNIIPFIDVKKVYKGAISVEKKIKKNKQS